MVPRKLLIWINVALCCILFVESLQFTSQGYLQEPWIQPLSVMVNSDLNIRNVTVLYKAAGEVDQQWTIDGFSPKDLDGNTAISSGSVGSEKTAKVSLPLKLKQDRLRLHLISVEHAYEVHLEFDIQHGIADVYADILPYTLFVPGNIGISQQGQTQFPVYVNTSNSPYMFGMLQADLVSLTDKTTGHVDHDVAYTFLPDLPNSQIRLVRRVNKDNTYHVDIALNSPKVYQNGGIVSVMAAGSTKNSVVKRLDIKQLLYLKPKPTTFPIANDSVGFVPTSDSESIIHVVEGENALIRCKAIGNPVPTITLQQKPSNTVQSSLQQTSSKAVGSYNVPSYSIVQHYEKLTVFQFINVTQVMTGTYVCRASVGENFVDQDIILSIKSKKDGKLPA